eukprot:5857381-Pleurochrysis_carterae.AAC.1
MDASMTRWDKTRPKQLQDPLLLHVLPGQRWWPGSCTLLSLLEGSKNLGCWPCRRASKLAPTNSRPNHTPPSAQGSGSRRHHRRHPRVPPPHTLTTEQALDSGSGADSGSDSGC